MLHLLFQEGAPRGMEWKTFYIYDGNEKITFNERDPQYQKILRDEFK